MTSHFFCSLTGRGNLVLCESYKKRKYESELQTHKLDKEASFRKTLNAMNNSDYI